LSLEDLLRGRNESVLAIQPAHSAGDQAGAVADDSSVSAADGSGDDSGVSLIAILTGVAVVVSLVASVVLFTAMTKSRPAAITNRWPATESSNRLVGTSTNVLRFSLSV
jgi:hypothetical protein